MKIQHLEIEDLLKQYGYNVMMRENAVYGTASIRDTNINASILFNNDLFTCQFTPSYNYQCSELVKLNWEGQNLSSIEEVSDLINEACKLTAKKIVYTQKILTWAERFHQLLCAKLDNCSLNIYGSWVIARFKYIEFEKFNIKYESEQKSLNLDFNTYLNQISLRISRDVNIAPPDNVYVSNNLSSKDIYYNIPVSDDLEKALALVDTFIPNLK